MRSDGFTLIEIMIVIAIIVGILSVAGSKLFSTSGNMRSGVRKIAITTREIRNNARMYNITTRLVIDMKDKDSHSYWVESAPGNALLLSEDQQKELERLTTQQRESEKPKNQFQDDPRVVKMHTPLPKGLFVESIEYASKSQPIESGIAYIHFFPQGLSEDVAIHLTNRKTLNWTIAVNPLTGRADVYERKISLKEIHRQ